MLLGSIRVAVVAGTVAVLQITAAENGPSSGVFRDISLPVRVT